MKKSKEDMIRALTNVVEYYDNNQIVEVFNKNDEVAIIVVDMINDFVFTSLMQNPLAIPIIPRIKNVLRNFNKFNKKVIHINEAHEEKAVEFESFPPHGVKGTNGAKIVEELIDIPYDNIFYKNSTNGMHIEDLRKWFDMHSDIKKIVIVGVCADICVLQFALGIKTYCNQFNRKLDVIIPYELVETYEADGHNRDLFYYMSLELAAQVGIKIVKNIEFKK